MKSYFNAKSLLRKILIERFKPVIKAEVPVLSSSELLKGRMALITGGSSGIGFSIAKSFLTAGGGVIITGRNKEKLDKALKELGNEDRVFGFVMDNSTVGLFEESLKEILVTISTKDFKKIDILVNNAGVNSFGMPKATELDYDKVMDTNLKGTYFLSQTFASYMVRNGIKGNILNIASASCLRPADSPYILSKWGIRSLTLGMAKSLGKYGITVNGIAPGPTATPMMQISSNSDIALSRLPLGRFILPEEIANMAVVLVSNMGRSIMGDMVMMTGGAGNLTFDDVPYNFEINQ